VTGNPVDYDLELEKIVDEIGRRRAGVVCIQLPEGLKRYTELIRERIQRDTDAVPVFSAEPCYGACDPWRPLESFDCDLVIHIGHSRMLEDGPVPVVYLPARSRISSLGVLRENLDQLKGRRIGLVASVQHVHELPLLKGILEDEGCEVHIGGPGSRTEHPGQVLGCNYQAAKDIVELVDLFLYVGGGDFHPLGVTLVTGKSVLVLDPYRGELRDLDELSRKILHRRFAAIERAKACRSFGLLVSVKPGQNRYREAIRWHAKLGKLGLKATILAYDRLDPFLLSSYDADAFVNFGCPRIPTDDSQAFRKPVLTPPELEIALGERSWEAYIPDEIA
jgi:2-(3-amino-3-carboxypropyl)histidine synthase